MYSISSVDCFYWCVKQRLVIKSHCGQFELKTDCSPALSLSPSLYKSSLRKDKQQEAYVATHTHTHTFTHSPYGPIMRANSTKVQTTTETSLVCSLLFVFTALPPFLPHSLCFLLPLSVCVCVWANFWPQVTYAWAESILC